MATFTKKRKKIWDFYFPLEMSFNWPCWPVLPKYLSAIIIKKSRRKRKLYVSDMREIVSLKEKNIMMIARHINLNNSERTVNIYSQYEWLISAFTLLQWLRERTSEQANEKSRDRDVQERFQTNWSMHIDAASQLTRILFHFAGVCQCTIFINSSLLMSAKKNRLS